MENIQMIDEITEKEISVLMDRYEGFVTREGCIKMIKIARENDRLAQKPVEKPVGITSMLQDELDKANDKASEDSIKDIDTVLKGHPNVSNGDYIDF